MQFSELGKAAKAKRLKLQLTQKQVAKMVGIDTNHYAKIERGETEPSQPTFKAIIKALALKLKIETN